MSGMTGDASQAHGSLAAFESWAWFRQGDFMMLKGVLLWFG